MSEPFSHQVRARTGPNLVREPAVRRLEDDALLRGVARFLDDLPPASAHAVFVRSPFAHARIASIDAGTALGAAGVLGVFAAADLELRPVPAHSMLPRDLDRPPLARDEVRFVGEPVAVVIAASRHEACDAAELVDVAYEPLPVLLDVEQALAADGSVVFALPLPRGADVLDGCARVAELRALNQRVASAPMEPDGAHVAVDDAGRLDVWASSQCVHQLRDTVAGCLDIDVADVRVRAPNVGGGFGGKFEPSPEVIVVAAAARRLGRSVRWVQTRTENLQTMPHGRAQRQHARLGLDAGGRFDALWIDVVNDAGAYAMVGSLIVNATVLMSPGPYRIARVGGGGRSVCTNRTPLGAYRGAGRPEATAMLERLIDVAAADVGVDPVELRRRNLIAAEQQPYTSATGMTYDSGDYRALLDAAVEHVGYAEARAEQARRRTAGNASLLGVGVAMWLDCTPMNRPGEHASVEVVADPARAGGVRVQVRDGANDQGQAHRTTWALLIGERTGLPLAAVDLGLGDTGLVPTGEGTGSARSTMLAGGAVAEAAALVAGQARAVAAHLLEAAIEDVVVSPEGCAVAGAPARGITWADLAAVTEDRVPGELGARIRQERGHLPGFGLGAAVDFTQPGPTFPAGCHAAVVEVDAETGRVRLLRFVAVDDCGTVINPTAVEGQQHGGIVQGIAQALYEEIVVDDDGNPLTATFADYGIPSAAEVPNLDVSVLPTPSPVNPLGVKGIGQAGAIGSTVAVQNAVVDAVAHLGVRHIDLPLTPERVWRAIHDAPTPEPAADQRPDGR